MTREPSVYRILGREAFKPSAPSATLSLGEGDTESDSLDAASRERIWLGTLSRALRDALRTPHGILDEAFDKLYPRHIRDVAPGYWTPVAIAARAAQLLVSRKRTRILDVGSGVGKFCIVGSLATGASFVGLERREHFVRIAEGVAARLGAIHARFIHGQLDALSHADFDAFYFYNPFEENMWGPDGQLDQTVDLSPRRFFADVDAALAMLERAPVGTRVVTYHGLGRPMPATYRRHVRESFHRGELELWVKA